MKRRPVGVPWWGEVRLSVRTPWDRAYSPGVLSCIGAIARAPERELMRKSEGCWCQGGPLWLAETLCFTYPLEGMEKWQYKVKSANGKDSVVHYVRDPSTGKLMDFKFTKHSQ